MAADSPDRYLLNMAKDKRGGRIFLDYLRNDRTSTAVGAALPASPPGSDRIHAADLAAGEAGLDPKQFTVRTHRRCWRRTAWKDYDKAAKPLRQAIERLLRMK